MRQHKKYHAMKVIGRDEQIKLDSRNDSGYCMRAQ